MQFTSSYTTEKKIKSLSERLKYLARDTNSARLYIDQNVKSANLKLNLSLVLSKIILELHFIDRSKKVFEKIIEDYNTAKETKLLFADFEKLNWIRIIAGEAKIPRLISHFVWQVGYYEKEGKRIEIPVDKNDLIRCLQIYSERCFHDSRLTISKNELENVLSKFALEELTINFLIEIEVIGFDSKADIYYWKGGEYSKHLKNEIASTLWLLTGGENATEIEFRKYLKLNEGAEIWIDDLGAFLNHKNATKISELAVSFLANENDLLKSEAEFTKIWLDSEPYGHIDIKTEIPVVEFNYNSAFDFIESVSYHKWRFHDAFDYQGTRSFCHSLLRIIVLCESRHPSPYQSVLKILKDTSRPSLLWTLYSDIKREFPFVIPYLLTDSELLPIAFKLIDKIEIDNLLLSEQSNSDREFEESLEVKNQFWFEMFELTLEQIISVHSKDKEKSELIAKILLDVSEKVFSINTNNRSSVINHNAFRSRYDIALKKLSNKKITTENIYPKPPVSPRLIHSLLPDIAKYLKEKTTKRNPNHIDHLNLNHGFVDLSIEMLRLANLRVSEFEISADEKMKLDTSSKEIITLLQKEITEFYSVTEIDVKLYNSTGSEKKKAKRGVSSFGFEIIDWGYLYLNLEKENTLQIFYDNFIASLTFKTDADKYDEQNKEQYENIKLYLKSLMLAFISINQKKDFYEIDGLPVKPTLEKFENWIRELSLKYSIDKIAKEQIDVFNERFNVFGYDMYYQQLTNLLYRSINYFKSQSQNEFVENFFAESKDTGRMLNAINILDSKKLRDLISDRIKSVEIEDFIASSFTTTELQYALIEAANSENHWDLAKPLIKRIQDHFKRVKHNDEHTNNLLFEINLLLAFKENDLAKLTNLPVPKREYQYENGDKKVENIKKFFIVLYNIYTDKNYDKAIPILKSLLSDEPKNIRYAFHLYRAETLKSIETKTNLSLLNQTNKDWKDFIDNLTDEEKKGLSELTELIASNSLHYLVATNDILRFDQTISRLSRRYLYDEEIIPIVYNYYVARDLHELAFDYLRKSEEFFVENGKSIPKGIQSMLDNSESVQLLTKYKISLDRIRGLSPTNIPKITPETVNDKRQLNKFILGEIIQSLRIIREKVEALRQVTHENRFNDFLQAILRLRLPIWGWSIHDQPRLGTSTGGADAGNADLVIQSGGGTSLALIEAFNLKGNVGLKKDKDYTELHILKCPKYVGTINKYYVIVYYLGNSSKFESKWAKYKADVLSISYPVTFEIDRSLGFTEITSEFTDVVNFKIAETKHNLHLEVFHIMMNLGYK